MTKIEIKLFNWLLRRIINHGRGYPGRVVMALNYLVYTHLQVEYPEDTFYSTASLMQDSLKDALDRLKPKD